MKHNKSLFYTVMGCVMLITLRGISEQYRVPLRASSILIEDYDGDGDKDILVSHSTIDGPILTICYNSGTGRIASMDSSLQFSGYQPSLFRIDLDSNGYPDFIFLHRVGNDENTGLRVLYHDESGICETVDFELNTDESISCMVHGDFNGDGFEDIAFWFMWCEQLGICYHDGLRGFQPPEYIQLPESSYDTMECGDLNGDGLADIAVAGDPVQIFFSQADGFDQIEFSRGFYDIKLGDMNGDGHLDLVGLNIFDLYIFENDGIGNFTERSVNSAPVFTRHLWLFEFNNDNRLDVVCSTGTNFSILQNRSSFQLSEPAVYEIGESMSFMNYGDIDGDGYNDIAYISNWWRIHLNILFNNRKGGLFWIPVESDEEPVIPDNFGLYASPNPFNHETRIILDLPDVITDAQLSVYDLMGRRVRHWPKSAMSPLRHEILWDGRDDNGQVLTSGIYLIRLNSPQKVLTAKTVLVR